MTCSRYRQERCVTIAHNNMGWKGPTAWISVLQNVEWSLILPLTVLQQMFVLWHCSYLKSGFTLAKMHVTRNNLTLQIISCTGPLILWSSCTSGDREENVESSLEPWRVSRKVLFLSVRAARDECKHQYYYSEFSFSSAVQQNKFYHCLKL